MRTKRAIVNALESACHIVDGLPSWTYWLVIRWLGCPSGLASLAARLDLRWGTGVFQLIGSPGR